ncbi:MULTISPECIES: GNAT family N-acetyltransferase [unclassified Leisingera]|uniref:GNAT family N-acetyltransferase n=1 Tax=unclassified Leisingera TaxID=2614906 RepID=UPI00126A50F7|nr:MULTISPECIES: GNAT family N-acetyltransferase [unclassified Leisingera]
MVIREMRAGDRAAVAQLQIASWRSVYAGVLPSAYLQEQVVSDLARHWQKLQFSDRDVVLVAEGAGIQGFITVWTGDEPYIDNLHVSETARSQGLGRRLMKEAARRLQAQGANSAYLWVAESNSRALAFYFRIGGSAGERKEIDVFGYAMPAIRVHWDSLDPLLKA